jgi:hypothetical protein
MAMFLSETAGDPRLCLLEKIDVTVYFDNCRKI